MITFKIDDYVMENERIKTEDYKQLPINVSQFVTTGDGMYTVIGNTLRFNEKNVMKFKTPINTIISKKDILVCYDNTKIVIIKKIVVRMYEFEKSEICNVAFIDNLKIAVLTRKNFVVFEFKEEKEIYREKIKDCKSVFSNGKNIFILKDNECLVKNKVDFVTNKTIEIEAEYGIALDKDNVLFINHNKVVKFSDKVEKERFLHTYKIKKIEYKNKQIYSLSTNGVFKIMDLDLNFKFVYKFDEICSFNICESILLFFEDGKILKGVKKEENETKRIKKTEILENMMKKFEYRNSLLYAIDQNDIEKTYALLKYLFDNDGIKQSLSCHLIGDVLKIINFINEIWENSEFLKINIHMMKNILDLYFVFFDEMETQLNELDSKITKELIIKEKSAICLYFLECLIVEDD